MTAPAQDWAEKAREIVHEWIDLPWEAVEWSSPQSDRDRLVEKIALALSDAARTGREEGLDEALRLIHNMLLVIPEGKFKKECEDWLDRALRGKERP